MASVLSTGTPILRSFTSRAGAEAFVKNTMPNLEASAQWNENLGEFIPIANLRSDQAFLVDRLTERGIKCVVDRETKRHVSDLMVQAGVDVLLAELQSHSDPADIVNRVYRAMEAKR